MLALKQISATHIVAAPAALDKAVWPAEAIVLRFATDEALVTPSVDALSLDDPHAIVVPDSGYAGAWLAADEALAFLERTCEWELPSHRPAFAQGAVAGIATKLWLEQDRVLFVVPAPFVEDFAERWRL
jgi:hypothetical protein